KKSPRGPADTDLSSTAERRRLGRVVHDDRGNARVEWWDVPADHPRPVLEVRDLSIESEGDPCNPYALPPRPVRRRGSGRPRDLRKLSEWIKLVRAMEEKKQRGED